MPVSGCLATARCPSPSVVVASRSRRTDKNLIWPLNIVNIVCINIEIYINSKEMCALSKFTFVSRCSFPLLQGKTERRYKESPLCLILWQKRKAPWGSALHRSCVPSAVPSSPQSRFLSHFGKSRSTSQGETQLGTLSIMWSVDDVSASFQFRTLLTCFSFLANAVSSKKNFPSITSIWDDMKGCEASTVLSLQCIWDVFNFHHIFQHLKVIIPIRFDKGV